jgi:hypothetical protein
LGAAVTLLSVLMSDGTSRQYVRGHDLALLVVVAILERLRLSPGECVVGVPRNRPGVDRQGRMGRDEAPGVPTVMRTADSLSPHVFATFFQPDVDDPHHRSRGTCDKPSDASR